MTQTQTHPAGVPDPDRRPDPDPGPDSVRTHAQTFTQTRTPDRPDPDRPDLGPGPGVVQTRTAQTRTQTPDRDDDDLALKISNGSGGPGPDDTRTRTVRTPDPDITLGPLARRRVKHRARERIMSEAIARGVDAERILREAEAAGEIEPDTETAPAFWERLAVGVPATLLTAVVAVLASVGQVEYARAHDVVDKIKLGAFDLTPWFAPAVLDLTVAALLGRGMHAAMKKQGNPWIAWTAAIVVGGFSVYTNTQHDNGAVLYAAATAFGLISWMVGLVYKYVGLPHVKAARTKRKQDRAGRRATANPRLLTTSLLFASRPTATRGWVIARRRPIALAAERLSLQEDQVITVRTLTIRAAELFNSVLADRRVAELDALGDPPDQGDKVKMKVWRERRRQAFDRAEVVAWDAVDELLGIPLIQRQGIKVNRMTYVEAEPQPQIIRRRALTDATAAAPAAPALPAAPAQRRKATAPALPPASEPDQEDIVIVVPGRPAGNAGANWMPFEEIVEMVPGLAGLPDVPCHCHPSNPAKYCHKTLVEHVMRRGEYIVKILNGVTGGPWDLRAERIGTGEIGNLINMTSKGLLMELSWVIDQVRAVAAERRAADERTASEGAVIVDDKPGDVDPEAPAA